MQHDMKSAAAYSRENPSPRYRELLAQYQHMHRHGSADIAPEKMFAGISLPQQAAAHRRAGGAHGG